MPSGLGLRPPSPALSLEGMDAQARIETMVDWFRANFEDPAEETPHDSQEGGYQYIWGGPYDALEELQTYFDDATDEEHEAAVERIEDDGNIYWAPAGIRIQPDDIEDDNTSQPPLTEQLEQLRGQLKEIEDELRRLPQQPSMLGHNQPPDEYKIDFDPEDVDNALASIAEVRTELDKSDSVNTADVEIVASAESRFRLLAKKIRGWAKAAGKMLVAGAIGGVGKQIVDDPVGFAKKIEEAADILATWAQHLHLPF